MAIGNTDHDEWKSPESQTLARPAYFADSSNPCTDVVAETAAALAMNYLNFKNEEDLYYAKALYEFAKTNNKGNHNSAPFYQGTCYLDDLALASIILYKATGTSSYKTDCANWISQSNWAYTTQQPLCWDSVWPAVNAIYANEWNRVAENIDVLKGKANSEGYACHDNWGSQDIIQLNSLYVWYMINIIIQILIRHGRKVRWSIFSETINLEIVIW